MKRGRKVARRGGASHIPRRFKERARAETATLLQFFDCSICTGTYITPMQTPCGHIFRAHCIQTVLRPESRANPIACPLCKAKITRRCLSPRTDIAALAAAVSALAATVNESSSEQSHTDDEEELLSLTPKPGGHPQSPPPHNELVEGKPGEETTAMEVETAANSVNGDAEASAVEEKSPAQRLNLEVPSSSLVCQSVESSSSRRSTDNQLGVNSTGAVERTVEAAVAATGEGGVVKGEEVAVVVGPQLSQVSATDEEDGGGGCSSPPGSPPARPLDLSLNLPSPVVAANRRSHTQTAMHFVQPLDFTMKKEGAGDGSPHSATVFKSPFPSGGRYMEPRSKPTDVVSPLRKRQRCSGGGILGTPTRISPFKRNLMRRFEPSPKKKPAEDPRHPLQKQSLSSTEEKVEEEVKEPSRTNTFVADSDVVCVDEVLQRSNKSKGNDINEDNTCFSEPLMMMTMGESESDIHGGIPGCTGIDDEAQMDSDDSDSGSSFLAPTPPRTSQQEEPPSDRIVKETEETTKSEQEEEEVNTKEEMPLKNTTGDEDGSFLLFNLEDSRASAAAFESEDNLIATDSFENALKKSTDLGPASHDDDDGQEEDVREKSDGKTATVAEVSYAPSESANKAVDNESLVGNEPGMRPEEDDFNSESFFNSCGFFTPPAPPPKKFVFCPTRLSRPQLSKLSIICEQFNGEITKDYRSDVTHLVINLENNRVPQTMKYLFAVADKKWVVIFDWIECCVKEGKMVPEERFETSSFPHCDKGARKSRLSPTRLFSGISFYFATPLKSTGAPIEDCKLLIEKMGGRIVSSIPTSPTVDFLIIGDSLMTNKTYQEWFSGWGWVAVTWEWVLDCLLTYSVVPFGKGHLITSLDRRSWPAASALPAAVLDANRDSFS